VSDMESLRQHLGFGAWGLVLGGSWGVALALAYAQAHPDAVGALLLRGVCLMRWVPWPQLLARRGPSCWHVGPQLLARRGPSCMLAARFHRAGPAA